MTDPTLGTILRNLRTKNGWTLKEMSARSGISFSTLTKIEHDRLTLTYEKLQSLCAKLDMSLTDLLAYGGQTVGVRANSRRSLASIESALRIETKQYDYAYMSPELRDKAMVPMEVRVLSSSLEEFGPLMRHPGEEYVYVLEGTVIVHTEFYDAVTLTVGQSIYFDSEMGHAYLRAAGCDRARILTICSSSQKDLLESLKDREAIASAA